MEQHGEPASTHALRLWEWRWFLLAVVGCLGLLAFRRPDAFTSPWFYAEEGRDFCADAYRDGWISLSGTVNGYFHLYPRIVANLGLSLGLSIAHMPWFNLAGVLIMYGVLWGYTFLRFPGPVAWRCIAVLCTVLPPLGNELWMNMTNVQWPMALLIPLIVFGRSTSGKAWRAADALVLGLACFTGPFALVFAPVLFLAWWASPRGARARIRRVHIAVIVWAAALQVLALFTYGSVERTVGAFSPWEEGFVRAVFQQLWYPVLAVGVRSVPLWAQVVLVMAGVGCLFIALRKAVAAWPFIGCAVVLVLVTLYSYRSAPGFLSPYDAGIRNFYLPTVLTAWSLAAVPWPHARRAVIIANAVLLWWAVQAVIFIGPKRYARPGIIIDEAAIARGETLEVPIDPPGWTLRLVPRGAGQEGREP